MTLSVTTKVATNLALLSQSYNTDIEAYRGRDRETDKQHTERNTDPGTGALTDTQTQTHRHRHTDTQTHRHTDTQTHRQTHRHTDTYKTHIAHPPPNFCSSCTCRLDAQVSWSGCGRPSTHKHRRSGCSPQTLQRAPHRRLHARRQHRARWRQCSCL